MSNEEYRLLQEALVYRPAMGDLLPHSGGLRKVRWKLEGRGKSGGVRVIYYWITADDQIRMLYVYPKNKQETKQLNSYPFYEELLNGGPMNKAMFQELLESVEQMDEIVEGKKNPSRKFEFPEPQVKEIREKVGLSQGQFARLIGVSKRTLENWEQGRRHPTGPAKALLKIVEIDPERALKALHG